ESVQETGLVQVDAGEGVALAVPVTPYIEVDTGLRKVTSLVPSRTGGDVYLWRNGRMVFIQFTGLRTSTMGTGTNFSALTLPLGFRPSLNTWDPKPLHAVQSEPQYAGDPPVLTVPRANIGTTGLIRFYGADPAQAVYYTATFMTADPAPETLPGEPA